MNDFEALDETIYEIKHMNNMKPETIYANSNVIKHIESENVTSVLKNASVPIGRKPALPPKPQKLELNVSSIQLVKCAASCGQKSSDKKDPAEMSLKERLALFEKNKGIALIPMAPLGMSASSKQMKNTVRNCNESISLPYFLNTLHLEKEIDQHKAECMFELQFYAILICM